MTYQNQDPGNLEPAAAIPAQQSVRFSQTQEEAAAALAAQGATATAETLGVDQASFDKYYKDGVFNYEAYGKEVAFKATQKPVVPVVSADEQAAADAAAAASAEEAATAANAEDVVTKAGLDWDAVTAQVVENGKLDEASKAKLMEIGVPEVVIDDYIRAVSKEAGEHIDKVMTAFGGEDGFNTVFEAVQTGTTEAQRDQIDGLLRDPATFDTGVELAKKLAGTPAAPGAATPVAGAQNQVAGAAAVTAEGFSSYEAQVAAQSDPRYKKDPEYRDGVIKRIGASTFGMNPRAHSGGM